MAGRMRALEGQFPWLVYESGGGVQGYCYAARFGERRGFDWSVETSIYMAHSFQGRGAGRKLYTALLHLLAMQGLRTAYARIGWPNPQSEGFHAGLGFSVEGLLKTAGYKFGQSAGIALYAKTLLPVRANPPAPVPFSALPAGPVAQVLARAAGEATE
jgi:phosphinothricin acetyltransferase